jgi:Flp pilus assembly protein TadB
VNRLDLIFVTEFALMIGINIFVRTKWAKANADLNNNVVIACGAAGAVACAFGGSPLFWAGSAVMGGVTVWAYNVDRKRRMRLKKETSE